MGLALRHVLFVMLAAESYIHLRSTLYKLSMVGEKKEDINYKIKSLFVIFAEESIVYANNSVSLKRCSKLSFYLFMI